jgi:chromosomal replication initiation ATPase DnaA
MSEVTYTSVIPQSDVLAFWCADRPSGLPKELHTSISARVGSVQFLVSQAFKIPLYEILRPTRGVPKVAFARQIAMYLCNIALGVTKSEIARQFNRDPSTIDHALHFVEDRRDDLRFDQMMTKLEQAIHFLEPSL